MVAGSISSKSDGAISKHFSLSGRCAKSVNVFYGHHGDQGPRTTMEDACRVIEQTKHGLLYAAIYDGHGGVLCVNELKNMLHLSLETQMSLGYHLDAALTRSFHYVDSMLLYIAASQVVEFQKKRKHEDSHKK